MHLKTLCLMALATVVLASSPARAQATRTWVSGVGDDANPCSRTAPCKTFAGAISKTAPGGEISALDPGGFGSVTITKAITIDAHNTMGGVLAAGVNGIVINAAASDVVVLRGLSIQGMGTGLNGIRFLSGKALHVEDCYIAGFTAAGIDFEPSASAQLLVRNTTVRDSGSADLLVGGTEARVTIEKSLLVNAPIGLDAAGASKVTVHDSVISNNATYGVRSAGTAEVNIDHGLIAHNGVGVQATSKVRLSEVMVADNSTGLAGNIDSFGNNRIAAGNTADGAPATTLPQQ